MPNSKSRKQLFSGFLLSTITIIALLINSCDRKKPVVLPMLFQDDVVVAFGDSLTYGTGARRSESYPAILSSLSNRKIINAGIPGEKTQEGLKRLPTVLNKHKPSMVLLCLGGNDFLRKVPLATTRKNLESMIGIMKNEGISIVLLTVPTLGFGLDPHPMYSEIAAEQDLVLVNDVFSEVLSDKSLKSDPIHPNAAGYRIVAEKIDEVLRKNGAY